MTLTVAILTSISTMPVIFDPIVALIHLIFGK